MKTIQRCRKVIYRWRCENCGSLLEEDDYEVHRSHHYNEYEVKTQFNYYCPVCAKRHGAIEETLHKYALMDDGTEYEIW